MEALLRDPRAALFFASLLAAFVALLLLCLFLGLSLGRRRGRLEAESCLPNLLDRERSDAVRRSRAIIGGQAAEQLAPYLPGFPFDPSECRFIGKPVDFLVFRGASTGRVEEVVFVEVKTGKSALNRVERSLKEVVEGGRLRWMEYRPPRI